MLYTAERYRVDFWIKFWIRFTLANLVIVAVLGAVMRYKIGFEFPFFNQKFIQHAHSHFAFAGWVTHAVFVYLLWFMNKYAQQYSFKRYNFILSLNMLAAYGMLFSFIIQGYGLASIFFSTVSTFTGWYFAFVFIKDLNRNNIQHPSAPWFRYALFYNIISAAGTFYLAYMMSAHDYDSNKYLMSVYYYLHFQYNGWFFLSCAGLFIAGIITVDPLFNPGKGTLKMTAWAVIPTYGLSVLWLKLPVFIYILVVVATLAQLYGWMWLFAKVKESGFFKKFSISVVARWLFLYIAAAVTIKLLLQLGSTIPAVSKLAFGFRPVVIAYLHLVLLAIISVSILVYGFTFGFFYKNRMTSIALILFVIAVLANELFLGLQGIAAFTYTLIVGIEGTLFIASIIIVAAAVLLFLSQYRPSKIKERG